MLEQIKVLLMLAGYVEAFSLVVGSVVLDILR
jgi:hypothetical protein